MLKFDRQTGVLTSLNLRAENHGDEKKSGADMKVTIKVSNDLLSEFHPRLKSSFYREPHPGEMDLADQANAENGELPLSRLLFGSKVSGLRWSHEIVGVTTTVHYGTGGKSDIVMDETTVDGFAFEFFDGGSVGISFRIKCYPDEKQIGKLANLIGHEIEFSLEPPLVQPEL